MTSGYDEPTQVVQVQDVVAIPVHIASSNAQPVRPAAPEFGTCMTWPVDTLVNMGLPIQLLTRRYRRHKARIYVASLGPVGAIVSGQGQVTAPAGGAVIATSGTGFLPGEYIIKWSVSLASGTPAAAEIDNFRLSLGGATALATSTNPAALGEFPQLDYGPIFLTGATAIRVQAVTAATAGVVYTATLNLVPTASPVGATLVLNSKREPLTLAVPQGFTIQVAPLELDWESQLPCFAVLTSAGNGPVSVSVMDEAYAET